MFRFKLTGFIVVMFVTIPVEYGNVIVKNFQLVFDLIIGKYIHATAFPHNFKIFVQESIFALAVNKVAGFEFENFK